MRFLRAIDLFFVFVCMSNDSLMMMTFILTPLPFSFSFSLFLLFC